MTRNPIALTPVVLALAVRICDCDLSECGVFVGCLEP